MLHDNVIPVNLLFIVKKEKKEKKCLWLQEMNDPNVQRFYTYPALSLEYQSGRFRFIVATKSNPILNNQITSTLFAQLMDVVNTIPTSNRHPF